MLKTYHLARLLLQLLDLPLKFTAAVIAEQCKREYAFVLAAIYVSGISFCLYYARTIAFYERWIWIFEIISFAAPTSLLVAASFWIVVFDASFKDKLQTTIQAGTDTIKAIKKYFTGRE